MNWLFLVKSGEGGRSAQKKESEIFRIAKEPLIAG